MRKLISLSFALLFISKAFTQDLTRANTTDSYEAYLEAQNNKLSGKAFPDFKIRKPGSPVFSNSDLKGKVVFVNFWFAGCPPCMAEMKGLNRMYDSLKNNKDFLFLSFTFDPDSVTQKAAARYSIPYPVIHIDKPECYRLNFKNGFPSNFILDKKGIIRFFRAGGFIEEDGATEDVMRFYYPKVLEQLGL